ncbi:MAG: 50S ribosome-binding GTPase [Methanomassiliicoccus sp.]|nr:50S ribosome-binding GTPase [Methanomassiliicoccus sp.]
MQDWRHKIPTIMTSQELLDKAYARASRVDVNGAAAFDHVKKTNIGKITAIGDMTTTTLLKYIRAFPRMEQEDEFYSQLIDVLIGHEKLKKALVNLSWCAEKCSELQRQYLFRVRKAPNIDEVAKITKAFYGRFSSVINRVEPDLLFCQKARDHLRQLPAVDTTVQTVVIAGYPNVGKSQLVERISTAKPTIAPYPFTTKGIIIGHVKSGWRTYQVIDTPGLLDRELEKRNAIELQAILALRYLADIIVFIIDPSETCGYTIDRQLALLDSVKQNFPDIPLLEVESKSDLEGRPTGRPRLSALTGEGVDELVKQVEGMLKAQRVNDLDKLPT